MSESLSQKEFTQLIMLVALTACFKPDEECLSEDQIIARNYAPTECFGRRCIANLIDSGVIRPERRDTAVSSSGNQGTLYIKRPVESADDFDSFVYKNAARILDILNESDTHAVYLKSLTQEVVACECIEYCDYYAQRAQLSITNSNYKNAKLRLLILECNPEKIHMLMWQAIKKLEKKVASNLSSIEFTDIIDLTFDRFTHYKKNNIEPEGYKRPSALKTSVLSGFIELYRNDN